ncbi:hypothetical protein P5W99_37450 [Paraburkholderia sp. A3BS-1L]|uniref:hypothetical protein n=1 Tax=Paraburkholderia sp. A3BS-1L TaxID=3028375 RepID=UPI003DA7B53B
MTPLRVVLERHVRRRVALAIGVCMVVLNGKTQRRQLAWAIRTYVFSVLLFAAACGLLHLLMALIFRRQ